MGGEARLAERVRPHLLAVARQAGAAVQSCTRQVQRALRAAVVGMTPTALAAGAASQSAQQHSVTYADLEHRGAHRLHHARAFVAEHDGQQHRYELIACADVCMRCSPSDESYLHGILPAVIVGSDDENHCDVAPGDLGIRSSRGRRQHDVHSRDGFPCTFHSPCTRQWRKRWDLRYGARTAER